MKSVFWGCAIAAAEFVVSSLLLRLLDKKYFYWVWLGGAVFRLVLVLLTALFITRFVDVHVPTTLISLVTAMTIFIIFNSLRVHKK